MPANDTSATPTRLPAALTWMPVQLVLLFVVLTASDLACQFLGALLVHASPAPLRDAARVVAALILSVVMIAAYRYLVRVLEQRTADELQNSTAVRGLVPGVLVGAGLFVLVYAILWALGAVTFGGFDGLAGIGHALAIAIASAVGEEIVFRGVVYRRLEERLGTAIALLISATVFGLVHAGNTGANWVSTLAIALESGVLLALAYAATRSLWLPIGLHFGWNVMLPFFGANLSGFTMGLTGYALHWSVGSLWSGGSYGPEGSLLTTLTVIALFWVVTRASRKLP